MVASGTAVAQGITMVFSPLITRLYGPEAFGLLGTFMAIVGVITPIAALSYPIAIVLPKKDRDAWGLAKLSALIALGMSGLVALLLSIARDGIVEMLRVQEIGQYVLLLPLVIVFSAWIQINRQWLIRKKMFKVTAKVAVLQAFILNCAKAGMGTIKPLGAVLIVLYTFGNVLHNFMLSCGVKRTIKHQERDSKFSKVYLWKLAKEHHHFALYQTPQVLLNAISQSLPVLMLAAYFGPATAGFYALCKRILTIPSDLIGKSVGDVFYPMISEAAHLNKNFSSLLFKATATLALIGFFPFSVVYAFGPWLFGYVFGAEWVEAGEYARWLSIWLFFVFMNPPSVKALIVLKKQHISVVINIISVFLRAGAIVFSAWWLKSALVAVAVYSIVGVLHNVVFISVAYNCSKAKRRH